MTSAKILIADDEDLNVELLSAWLGHLGYDTEGASNGREAVLKALRSKPDLIILDVMMPVMDGSEACRTIRGEPETKNIPVIMVTGLNDRETRLRGLEAGANDFLSKPIDRAELTVRVRNLLAIKAHEDFMRRHNQMLEEEVQLRTHELNNALQELRSMGNEMVQRLMTAAEFRDTDTGAHIARIAAYSRRIAEAMGLSADFVETINFASSLHDIGKIGIPDRILLKQAPLTGDEAEVMKSHTVIGWKMLSDSSHPGIQTAASIALNHHERWEGGGYPRGIKGKDIPLEARIVKLVDEYDALRSNRPYKAGLDHDAAYKVITKGDGRTMPGHFDPDILRVFSELAPSFNDIFRETQ